MVKFFFFIIMWLTINSANAQIKFLKVFTDAGFEKGEGITQLQDSSYLVTGSSTSFESGPPKAYLMKIDSVGNHLWSKHYGGSEINEGKRIFALEGDAYYLFGNTNSNTTADFNLYFVKTDENGQLLSQKQFGTSGWDFVNDAVMLSDSTFILTGETYNTSDGMTDAYTVRIDRNGDTLWTRQSHKTGKDKINAIETVGDSAFVIAGTVWNPDSLAQKSFVGFYSNDNSVIWEKEYGVTGDFELKDVVKWNDILHCVGNRILIIDSLHDEYVHRINLLGDTLSYYSYLGNSDKSMKKLLKYGNSNKFYVAISSFDQYSYGVGDDIYIARFDDYFGYDYSGVTFRAGGQDDIGDFINTSDGGAIMVGTNRSFGNGNGNVFVLKIGKNDSYPNTTDLPFIHSLVEIEESKVENKNAIFYPNPTFGKLYLEVPEEMIDSEIRIYNTVGQICFKTYLNNNISILDVSTLEDGFYSVIAENKKGDKYLFGKLQKQ